MTEREIRRTIHELCDELDRAARRIARRVVLPSMLGAGLALSTASCGESTPMYALPPADQKIDKGPVAEYGVPHRDFLPPGGDLGVPADKGTKTDPGVAPLYAAPDGDPIG